MRYLGGVVKNSLIYLSLGLLGLCCMRRYTIVYVLKSKEEGKGEVREYNGKNVKTERK